MKPNELRIGNYVKSEVNLRHQMTVLQLFGDSLQADFGNGTRGGIMYENCEGIPLTEQWLKDFGWVETGNHPNEYYLEINQWNVYVANYNTYSNCISSLGVLTHDENGNVDGITNFAWMITSVHRFQNIMFAVSETELTKHP